MAGREASLSDSLLRVEEVCDLLRVGPAFVYRHAAELGGVKVGRHLRFRKDAINAWLDSRKVQDPDDWRFLLEESSCQCLLVPLKQAPGSASGRR